ncbi:MAG: hypothetical protein BWY76_00956 [bacterium ADurb.Bin429]|nr:MAG: hypothetical protein BWY76_00956 [bacterium ADurb.Bin429]
MARVVAVLSAMVVGGGGDHRPLAVPAPQDALQQRAGGVARVLSMRDRLSLQDRLHLLEQLRVDNRLVFAVIDRPLVLHLPEIRHIGEQPVQGTAVERRAGVIGAVARHPGLRRPSLCACRLHHRQQSLVRMIQDKEFPHDGRFRRIDQQLGAVRVEIIAEYRRAADEFSFFARGGHLVFRALSNHCSRRVGMERLTALRRQVSPNLSPNRTCSFPSIRLSMDRGYPCDVIEAVYR